ncbi:hypothetical protein PsorP6_010483 [Peronosclerospora sorghi]|uniref:Uncharacterized protein n=1 Tax=Peronosclerospora sorghi TaxID=230839 RepID=A0ACC0VY11_9STRA|nr:hypothetical protein PsorP6_010483 [Peronosclerospora sorghi]
MVVSRPSPTQVQCPPSFWTQLKAIPPPPSSSSSSMPTDEPHWASSPTSIATPTTSAHALPSFTFDASGGRASLPLGYYSSSLAPSRGPSVTSTWTSSSTYAHETTGMLGTEFLQHHHHHHGTTPAPPPPFIPPSVVLQQSDALPRGHDDDLVMDAQMLHEVLQGMPGSGQTPVHGAGSHPPRGQQIPGLHVLFAMPLAPTEVTPTPPTYYPPLTTTPADLFLPMSQPSSSSGMPSGPLFPSSDRPPPPPLGGLPPPYDHTLAAAAASTTDAAVPVPLLPRKKRTTATRICKVDGCTKGIRSRGLCKAHGGGRRCTTPGCTTSDQGGGHCVLHGGGRRCRIEGCKKSAQWRGVCKMHGGARRCRYGQCTKNGQVKQGYCRMHHNLLTAQRQQQDHVDTQTQQHAVGKLADI